MAIPKHAKHLSVEAKKIYRQISSEYSISDTVGLRYLLLACEAFDRGVEAREILASEGMTFIDRHGQIKKHPMIGAEKSARDGFLSCMKALKLDIDPTN